MLRNAIVITPLKSEFNFLVEALSGLGFMGKESAIGPIGIIKYEDLNLTCAIGGHGKVQFGIQTQFLLHNMPNVTRVFCAGAAGGLAGVKTFDVVVAEQTVEHDYTERFDPSAILPSFQGCEKVLQHLKEKMHQPSFRVHFGKIASGDEDVVSAARADEIQSRTKSLAVAWEGAGGARAAVFNGKPFLEIRGITDVADNAAPIDFRANLKTAMANVAVVLEALILEKR